jgi:hypothetical protein
MGDRGQTGRYTGFLESSRQTQQNLVWFGAWPYCLGWWSRMLGTM